MKTNCEGIFYSTSRFGCGSPMRIPYPQPWLEPVFRIGNWSKNSCESIILVWISTYRVPSWILCKEIRTFVSQEQEGSTVPTGTLFSYSYLWTYDLYGPIRNAFDASRYITRASGKVRGGWGKVWIFYFSFEIFLYVRYSSTYAKIVYIFQLPLPEVWGKACGEEGSSRAPSGGQLYPRSCINWFVLFKLGLIDEH